MENWRTQALGALSGAVLLVVSTATAAQQFLCDPPKGKRVDFGDIFDLGGKKLNSAEEGARWDDDGFSNMRPLVVIDENLMRVAWGNAVPNDLVGKVDPSIRFINIPITHRDDISVSGTIAGGRTVDIFRYYFNYNTLFRLMSSVALVLQPPESAPAMAAIYVSQCQPIR